MIVKISTRKKPTFKQLLNYMLHHKERDFKGFVLKHNVRGNNIEEWVKQFKENEIHRKIQRLDSVILSHEILSWHRDDRQNITLEKMEEMAREYIKLRNPSGMAIAVSHSDKQHLHIHFCFSGLEYHTGKSLRMSKGEFTKLKQDIQNFQREKFPELENSIVEHGRNEKKDLALPDCRQACTDKEWQIKNSGRATDKEKIISILEDCYRRASFQKDFFEMVQEAGLETYMRGGKITGVVFQGRKFRYKKIGFSPEWLERLEMSMIRNKEIKKVRQNSKSIQKER